MIEFWIRHSGEGQQGVMSAAGGEDACWDGREDAQRGRRTRTLTRRGRGHLRSEGDREPRTESCHQLGAGISGTITHYSRPQLITATLTGLTRWASTLRTIIAEGLM